MTLLRFDPELIRRYDCHGPRYTSYPTAVQFSAGFDASAYRQAAAASQRNEPTRPISLYAHIPFCSSPCFYCGCNRIITSRAEKAQGYLERLHGEIELQAALFSRGRRVEQLHFGGGTPTFLTNDQLARLMAHLGRHFSLSADGSREYSIEIDPRTVSRDSIAALAALGFNRMSLGVQDFDPQVQQAVNRIQSVAQTREAIDAAREQGFGSIGIDLIYGLPRQTLAGFYQTLRTVLDIRPDRLAVYGYAHLPQLFKAQRRLSAQDLPSPQTRLNLLLLAIETLTGAGYEYIGMDHFALPDDELSRAKRDGTLHRNFQGYSTRASYDLVGLGVSAIGNVGASYAQNHKDLRSYYRAIDDDWLPIQRGIELDADDLLRRAVIGQLMCQERVDFAAIEAAHAIDFRRYFASELQRLQPLEVDGLVCVTDGEICITDSGRLLMRNVAMIFDAYLGQQAAAPVYSKAI